MIHIAILGYGNIGSGTADVLVQNAANIARAAGDRIHIKYILDLREFPGDPLGDRVVHDMETILADADVSVVAEMMGGSHPAYEYSMAALRAKKSVVTSNKEVVANFGAELLQCARENGVSYLFEASVGGGIPIIHPLCSCLAADEIDEIDGILNGTTNYILTRMFSSGASFADALAEAKALGYAEPNPSADVDGIDTQRKICILAALAFGSAISPGEILTESMRNITIEDMDAAVRWGGTIKMIGRAVRGERGIQMMVAPCFVRTGNPLANIEDVFNGIMVRSRVSGDLMFYGRGAGKYPTAGSVVADIVHAVHGTFSGENAPRWHAAAAGDYVASAGYSCARYLRVDGDVGQAADLLGAEILSDEKGELILPAMDEAAYRASAERLSTGGIHCRSHIRIL